MCTWKPSLTPSFSPPISLFQNLLMSPPLSKQLLQLMFSILISLSWLNAYNTLPGKGSASIDSYGHACIWFTLLVSWITNLPEQGLVPAVLQNQSLVSTATLDDFRDGPSEGHWPYNCWDYDGTMQLISTAITQAHPFNIPAFVKVCQPLGLLGVHQPFWCGWGLPLQIIVFCTWPYRVTFCNVLRSDFRTAITRSILDGFS